MQGETETTQTANPLPRRGPLAATSVVIAIALAFPAASAAVVTIGSDLGRAPTEGEGCGPTCTISQGSLGAGSQAQGGLMSPVNGTVIRWRIRVGASTTATSFRVIRPLGGNLFTGAGTSSAVTPPANASTPYDTQLAIRIGDGIGLDCCDPGSLMVRVPDAGAIRNLWIAPTLGDGSAGRPPATMHLVELTLNADIEPTSAFTIDKVKAKEGGKVKVIATLPNPGSLTAGDVRDARVATAAATAAGKRKKRLKRATMSVAGPGQITFFLRPTKAAKEKLRTETRLKAKVKLAFTPAGGTAASETDNVKLKS